VEVSQPTVATLANFVVTSQVAKRILATGELDSNPLKEVVLKANERILATDPAICTSFAATDGDEIPIALFKIAAAMLIKNGPGCIFAEKQGQLYSTMDDGTYPLSHFPLGAIKPPALDQAITSSVLKLKEEENTQLNVFLCVKDSVTKRVNLVTQVDPSKEINWASWST
jgi:hypothetical protein